MEEHIRQQSSHCEVPPKSKERAKELDGSQDTRQAMLFRFWRMRNRLAASEEMRPLDVKPEKLGWACRSCSSTALVRNLIDSFGTVHKPTLESNKNCRPAGCLTTFLWKLSLTSRKQFPGKKPSITYL